MRLRKISARIAALSAMLICLLLLGACVKGNSEESESTESTVTLTAFIQQADVSAGTWKGWGALKLSEDTGLVLQSYSSEGREKETLRTRLSSGTVPDIIGFESAEEAQLYMEAGILLSFDEYEEVLTAIYGESEYSLALSWIRENVCDGELLLLPVLVGASSQSEYRSLPMLMNIAGIDVEALEISTLEDYLDALELMKSRKYTSNLGESMYGISLWKEEDSVWTHVSSLAAMYGIDLLTVSSLMETDMGTLEMTSIFAEDSFFKRAVHFYYEANQRGLLDVESANQTYNNVLRKVSEGRVFFVTDIRMASEDDYVVVTAEDMTLYQEADHPVGTGQYLAVNQNSDHVEEALTFLNWLYAEDTIFYLYNGPEGGIWEYNEDGIPYVTEAGLETLADEDAEIDGYTGTLASGTDPFGSLPRTGASLTDAGVALQYLNWGETGDGTEESQAQTAQAAQTSQTQEAQVPQAQTIQASEAVYLIETMPTELYQISEDIETLVEDAFWDLIYAEDEEEFEALWLSLCEEAREAGMEQVEKFYIAAWERALEAAEKLSE